MSAVMVSTMVLCFALSVSVAVSIGLSAVFGMQLPGPGSIYISQTLNFKAPVKIDDVVVTTVKVIEIVTEKKRARFETICAVNGKPVLSGEAVLMVPLRPMA